MSKPGSESNPLRVAIVGAGPSGFYAADALLKSGLQVSVDMFDRLPTPFGLVRAGVAPDHPKIKTVVRVYDKTAESPGFSFFGNIMIGRDVKVSELRKTHHAIIFTNGAESDRRLGVPGEDLPGSYTATEFVYWYNGHPDYRDRVFDLSHEVAVIIGQGNVAADVCRILAKTVDELKETDIAEHALEALSKSRIRHIHMVGRRGPTQAKFTTVELKEFRELSDCDPAVDPKDLVLNPASQAEIEDKRGNIAAKNMAVLREFADIAGSGKSRRCHFRFLEGPVALEGNGRLAKVILEKNRLEGEPFEQSARPTGEKITLECGLLFRSIGYKGLAIAEVPFDERKGIIPNREGRVTEGDKVVPGLYCAGWIKRGPSGIIGTNKPDSQLTVEALLADVPGMKDEAKPGGEGLKAVLSERKVRMVSYADWRRIDAAEVARGEPKGKPREKFTRIGEMLAVLR